MSALAENERGTFRFEDEDVFFLCAEVLTEGVTPCPAGVRFLARNVVRLLGEAGDYRAIGLLSAISPTPHSEGQNDV